MTMVTWVGGLMFFAFVLAPVAFHILPSTHEAGLVVGGTLIVLHRIGMACGTLFLLATSILWLSRRADRRTGYLIQLALVAIMLSITAYLQNSVLPRMERDRVQAGGDIDATPTDDPARRDFERLHPLSERFEGVALLAGLGIVFLMATQSDAPETVNS
ncbi:hypothetical protein HDF17_003056 [Granulicella arctica]|uniref:TMEM205-like domain-containing protein n=2 Tax=Granulicella arctica TaxID=940613 RepID=A0A7Y9PKD5_9BACT|nr:hypothetical protein [Granulicella arctica]